MCMYSVNKELQIKTNMVIQFLLLTPHHLMSTWVMSHDPHPNLKWTSRYKVTTPSTSKVTLPITLSSHDNPLFYLTVSHIHVHSGDFITYQLAGYGFLLMFAILDCMSVLNTLP